MKTPCEESTLRFNTHKKHRQGIQRVAVQETDAAHEDYLQAAEDSEQVVEGHHVAVDRHQAQKPGGADEQQKDEGHSESRAEEEGTYID